MQPNKENDVTTASDLLEEYFDRLMAVAHQRMHVELGAHQRRDLAKMEPGLTEMLREFGNLLRTVLCYDIPEALRQEARWFASALSGHGPGRDAFSLLIDSWIIAIQGIIPSPACNVLTSPLQILRHELPMVFSEMSAENIPAEDAVVLEAVARLCAGEQGAVLNILREQVNAGKPLYDIIPNLLLRAMTEIGRLWESDRIPIYQEHIATETLIGTLAALPGIAPVTTPLDRKAMTTCSPSDHMQVVPMALTVYLQLRGWSAISLGQGLPPEEICAAVEAMKPDAIFLSLAMVSRIGGALKTVGQLHASAQPPVVIVGGRGALIGRRLFTEAGAHVAEDFDHAHRLALTGGAGNA